MPESKKCSLKPVALAVDHQMTTGITWCSVNNMVTPKIKVTNGAAWRPVSHEVSWKVVFVGHKRNLLDGLIWVANICELVKTLLFLTYSEPAKITTKFLTCLKSAK